MHRRTGEHNITYQNTEIRDGFRLIANIERQLIRWKNLHVCCSYVQWRIGEKTYVT